MIDIFKNKERLVIHTPKLENYMEVVEYALDCGYKWNGLYCYNTHESFWSDRFRTETCVSVSEKLILFGSYEYYTIWTHLRVITMMDFYNLRWFSEFV